MSEGFHEWPGEGNQPRWPQPQPANPTIYMGEEQMRSHIVQRQLEQASWRPDPDPRTALRYSEIDLEARRYGAEHPDFEMVRAMIGTDRTPVVLNRFGAAAWPPTSDLRNLLDQWQRTEEPRPGFACGPESGLLAVSFTEGAGLEWLYRARLEPIRQEDVEDPRRPPRPYVRDHYGSQISLGTVPPTAPPITSISFYGQRGANAASARLAERQGSPRVVRRVLFWTWPAGQRIRFGEAAPGVLVLDACPSEGAIVVIDGEEVAGGMPQQPLLPAPDWLINALGGRPIAPAGYVPRRTARPSADGLGVA